MNDVTLPASVLLYITGATTIANIIVNGVRTSIEMPAAASFAMAVLLGFIFVVLLMVANNVEMTIPLWAASVIAGVLVGGASAGTNAVHNRTKPTARRAP